MLGFLQPVTQMAQVLPPTGASVPFSNH